VKLHYLTPEEEQAIKSNIPWPSIDRRIRELVKYANTIDGIATVQSCAGHIRINERGEFHISSAHIAFYTTYKRLIEILFVAAPQIAFEDVSIRYFRDGTFWVCVECDPAEKSKLYDLFRILKGENFDLVASKSRR